MATIRDVAKMNGYSITTVSRVLNLNHSGYVSQMAQCKIKQVMSQLDYVPNALARDLSNGNSHKIGVILPQIRATYFAQILNGIVEAAFLTDYSIILLSSEYDARTEINYLEQFRRKDFDGLIVTSHGIPLKRLVDYNKCGPIVCCEIPGDLSLTAVFTDRLTVFLQIFQWLKKQQITRIACMFYRQAEVSATIQLTLQAYQQIFQRKLSSSMIITGISSPMKAYKAVTRLTDKTQCVLVNSDAHAIAVRQYYLDHHQPIL